jgi:hypothetical protein
VRSHDVSTKRQRDGGDAGGFAEAAQIRMSQLHSQAAHAHSTDSGVCVCVRVCKRMLAFMDAHALQRGRAKICACMFACLHVCVIAYMHTCFVVAACIWLLASPKRMNVALACTRATHTTVFQTCKYMHEAYSCWFSGKSMRHCAGIEFYHVPPLLPKSWFKKDELVEERRPVWRSNQRHLLRFEASDLTRAFFNPHPKNRNVWTRGNSIAAKVAQRSSGC